MIRRTIVFLALLSCFWTFGQAQNTEFIIWGRVVVSNGGLPNAAGIEVRLENPGHVYITSITTDSDGRFQFRHLNAGTFILYINLPGFDPVSQEVRLTGSSTAPGGAARVGSDVGTAANQPNVVLYLRRGGVSDFVSNSTYRDGNEGKSAAAGFPAVLNAEVFKKYAPKAVREFQDGLADTAKGNTDKAISHYGKALEIEPKFHEAMVQLGSSRLDRARSLEQSGKAAESQKSYQEAAALLGRAAELEPDSAEGNYLLGSALFKTNDLPGAESRLKLSIGATKPHPGARLMLVNVYMKERRYRDALDQLNAYLEATPASPERKAAEQLQSQIQRALPR